MACYDSREGPIMKRIAATSVFALAVLLALGSAAPAHAYLDPGAGTMLLQGILGAFLAVGVTLRIYWRRIRDAVRRRFAGGAAEPESGRTPENR